MMFSASFDPHSLSEIAQLYGFSTLLSPQVQAAEQQIGDLIVQKTHDNAMARFLNNTPGGLAESFVVIPQSPYELEVGSPLPYAHRRDQGFVGADSLGRVYHDRPYLYFSDAVAEVQTSGEGLAILQQAVQTVLDGIGG